MIIITSSIILFLLYFFGNLFPNNFYLSKYEKPIFATGLIILLVNYSYFNLNLSINFFFYFLCLAFLFSIFFSIFKKKKIFNDLKFLITAIFILIILFQLIIFFLGEQHYVFRGNRQDYFSYVSSGLAFYNYNYSELIEIRNNFNPELNDKFYLKHILNIVHYRPSAQLFLALLNNLKFIDIIKLGFIFKIFITFLVLLSAISFFDLFEKRKKFCLFLSYCFVLSFFYFYNFEIDALSLIFSLPFLILILKYSTFIEEKLIKIDNTFFLKYVFLWSCYFIIYPNGAAIIMPPIFLYILYYFYKNKFNFYSARNLFFYLLLFLIIIAPTYKTTILYLIEEIKVGITHKNDFWGYFGAFILGKDNPIHNAEVISKIKNLWFSESSIFQILNVIANINVDYNNNFFFLNIIPSTLGFFHMTTSYSYGNYNYILILLLIILNILLIKIIINNTIQIFQKKDSFNILIKFFLIYFIIFFLYLIFANQYWSSIKLYFVLSPIFFIIITFNFSSKKIKPLYNYILVLLIILPIYKYSSYNYGIGRLDSFPSIIKKQSKELVEWNIDRKKLFKCRSLKYDIDDMFKKIYVSLIFGNKINAENKSNCLVKVINRKFEIIKLK